MKKLYGKRKIHPSNHHQPTAITDQYLSFLPATILTPTVTLSVEDREVLAYLISCNSTISLSSSSVVKLYSNRSNNNSTAATSYKKSYSRRSKDHHPVLFNCNCFTCYMSYWVRWDSSSNRQLIHEIIDAYEDELTMKKMIMTRKKDRRNKKAGFHGSNYLKNLEERRNMISGNDDQRGSSTGELKKSVERIAMPISDEETGEEDEADESGRGTSITKCMNFLVSKILDIWNPK